MKKINYNLSTLSSVVLSPRESLAWYEELCDFKAEQLPEDEYFDIRSVNVIYPFYQYGMYTSERFQVSDFVPEYYVPGSSIKGALNLKNAGDIKFVADNVNFMVDDVAVQKEAIVLRNLYKIQYIQYQKEQRKQKEQKEKMSKGRQVHGGAKKAVKEEEDKRVRCKPFMSNIGVEMLRAGSEMHGELYAKTIAEAEAALRQANQATMIKIKQMTAYLRDIQKLLLHAELPDVLKKVIDNLESFQEEHDVIILGGYKGLVHSVIMEEVLEDRGAVFLDCETNLPHGLVKMQLDV